jgi:hypothetical protein
VHSPGSQLALTHPGPASAAATAQLHLQIGPQRARFQVVLDEDVVDPIKSPLLDG